MDPCFDRALTSKRRQLGLDRDESALHDVLRLVDVGEDPGRQREHRVCVEVE